MPSQVPGDCNVPSMVCANCCQDLQTAFAVFNLAAKSTAYFLKQHETKNRQLASTSRNGDSAASIAAKGRKTYFPDEVMSEEMLAIKEENILMHCEAEEYSNQMADLIGSVVEPKMDSQSIVQPDVISVIGNGCGKIREVKI